MLQYRVWTNPRLLRAVTGFARDEVDRLLPRFTEAYQQAVATERAQRPRRRRPGGGRKGQLVDVRDKLLFTDRTGRRIVYLGATARGSTHDKIQAETDAPPFPPDSRGGADLGFQGYHPPNLVLTIPLKKPKGGELTGDERAANTALAKLRVPVEHAIRGMKRQRIVTAIFRNTSAGMLDLAAEVSAGLYNLTNQYRYGGTPVGA